MFQELRSGDSVAVGGPERLHKWELGLQEWMKFDEFRSQHAFSLKSQLVIILVFAGYVEPLLQPFSSAAVAWTAVDNTEVRGHGCVPAKLYLQKETVGQV